MLEKIELEQESKGNRRIHPGDNLFESQEFLIMEN
jgi:hypothetical protein